MKRACYEWGSILSTGIAVCCLVGWVASVWSKRPAAAIEFDGHVYVLVSRGTFVLANISKPEVFGDSDFEAFFDYYFRSYPEDHRFDLPGLRYRGVTWTGPGYNFFALEISLLIPACIAAILGACSYWQLRRTLRLAAKPPAS